MFVKAPGPDLEKDVHHVIDHIFLIIRLLIVKNPFDHDDREQIFLLLKILRRFLNHSSFVKGSGFWRLVLGEFLLFSASDFQHLRIDLASIYNDVLLWIDVDSRDELLGNFLELLWLFDIDVIGELFQVVDVDFDVDHVVVFGPGHGRFPPFVIVDIVNGQILLVSHLGLVVNGLFFDFIIMNTLIYLNIFLLRTTICHTG